MSLIHNHKLERNIQQYILEIKHKNFIAGDQNLELIKLRFLTKPLHGNINVMPLIVLDTSPAREPILIIIEYTVHIGPVLDGTFPMFEG